MLSVVFEQLAMALAAQTVPAIMVQDYFNSLRHTLIVIIIFANLQIPLGAPFSGSESL